MPARGELWINDDVAGEVSPGGSEVEVPVTYTDPTWSLYTDDDDVADGSGVLERTDLDPFTTAGLFGCSSLLVPPCVGAGFCVANPTVFVLLLAPLNEVLFVSGLNALRTSVDSPSWPTVPVMVGCALLGLTPLLLLPFALRAPDEISLPVMPSSSSSSSLLPLPVASSREVAY